MPPDAPDLLVVLGSTTPPGRLRRALTESIERSPLVVDFLDLAEVELAFADGRDPATLDDDTEAVIERFTNAPAAIFATPVYRGSLTGALKNVLDFMPVPALADVPVGIVAMGGTDHHFLGPERHIRDILAFFGARAMPVAVYFNASDFEDGAPSDAVAAKLDELLDATAGTARALAEARDASGPLSLAAEVLTPRR